VRAVLARLKPIWDNALPLSIASTVIGIVLILLAEFGDVHEVRVFGAILITNGGIGLGIHTGLADPRKLRVPDWLRQWRSAIAVTSTVLVVAPAVVVLVGLLLGTFGDADGNRDGLLMALGLLIGIAMLAAVLATSILSIKSMLRASNEPPEAMAHGDWSRATHEPDGVTPRAS
jgi:hypothetical protein